MLLDGARAAGVECRREGRHQRWAAGIIVCGGALQSPALLLRSGIGPAGHLAEVGIDCAVDLAGVGENLMDHQGTAVFLIPRQRAGAGGRTGVPARGPLLLVSWVGAGRHVAQHVEHVGPG